MASKQPIRIDTVEIQFDIPKSPFSDIEKSIETVTSSIDSSTKEIKQSFANAFKNITKSADEISLDQGIKDLEYMQGEIKHLESEYTKATQKLKSPFASVRFEAQQDLKLITRDLEEFKSDYQKTQRTVSDLQNKIQNTSAFTRLNNSVKNVFNNIKNSVKTKAITSFDAFKQKINSISFESIKQKAKQALSEAGSYANKARDSFGKMGQAIGKIPSLLAGIGVTVGMKQVLDLANEIQKSGNSIQIKTTLQGADLKEAKEAAKELYNKGYGENFTEVSNAFATANQLTGKTGAQLKSLSQGALDLSRAFDFDVQDSIRAADTLITQFGISGSEAYDLMIQGTKLGLNSNGDLLDTINEYSVQFKKMGFSGYEMFDMLKSSADAGGFSIDKIGDSFKEFSLRGIEYSNTTAEGFALIGKDANTMIKKLASGGTVSKDAFNEIISGLKAIEEPEKRNAAGVALFGRFYIVPNENRVKSVKSKFVKFGENMLLNKHIFLFYKYDNTEITV